MHSRSLVRIALTAVIGLAAASCGSAAPTPSAVPPVAPSAVATTDAIASLVGIVNATTVPVTISVNGMVIETVAAGGEAVGIDAALSSLPWSIEARSPSGKVLATLPLWGNAGISSGSSVGVVEDLVCGRVTLWAGGPRPDAPVPTVPKRPCA